MRSTCVDALYTKNGYWYIVVSPSSVDSTFIITVDCTTGNPLYTGVPFLDIFPDHEMAIESLTEIGAVQKVHGEGLIGIVSNETTSTIAIIDKTYISATIPPNHEVKTIRHTTFINIPLRQNVPKSSIYEDFQLNYNHFFCDTYDLTNLYPVNDTNRPDYGFVWNNGWRKPFEILGIPQVCINLIQGVCVSKVFKKFNFSLCYVCRRSVLNPGTRYAARGLNDLNSPGNEVECELIFYKSSSQEYWTERWRRGSIPIRWKTVLSSKLSAPKHKVDKDYFKGTVEYFKGLTDRFGEGTTIRCVSLLQTESDHSESQIKEFFKKALNRLYENGVDNVFLTPFDLNHHLHEDGSGEAMMDFLSYIGPLCDGDGFTHGKIPNEINGRQKGLMRFNCADSLDRTNLATFYFAMKMTADWCKENKTGLSNTPDSNQFQPNLIVDQSIIDFLAKAFVESGNVVSQLYTNTQAIKTNAIKKFSPSVVVTTSDTNISVQRRLQNVMNDPQRQKVIELWTQPMPLSWYHRIDPRHIFIVPNEDENDRLIEYQFPRTVFSANLQQIDVKSKELLLCLPTPMILFSFMFLVYPVNQQLKRVSVKGGMIATKMEKIIDIFMPAVEQPIWLRFRPNNAVKWGFEKSPKRYIRFLSFSFETPDDVFSIGNIRIESKSVFCGEAASSHHENSMNTPFVHHQIMSLNQLRQMVPSRSTPTLSSNSLIEDNKGSSLLTSSIEKENDTGLTKSLSMQRPGVPKSGTNDSLNSEVTDNDNNLNSEPVSNSEFENDKKDDEEDLIQRFSVSFDKFVRSPQNFANVLELEKVRVGLGLDEIARVRLALIKGISPWIADSRARLAMVNLKECPFCRLIHTEGVRFFCPSSVFPGLIKLSKFHEKGGFPVCKTCNEIAENFANITNAYELHHSLLAKERNDAKEDDQLESQIETADTQNANEEAPQNTENLNTDTKTVKQAPLPPLPSSSSTSSAAAPAPPPPPSSDQTADENGDDADEISVTNSQSERQHQIDEVEERRRHDKSMIPHFETCGINRELCKGLQAVTHEANAAFLNTESSLLWASSGSETIKQGEEKHYDMYIVHLAVVMKLVITAKVDRSKRSTPLFEVIDQHKKTLHQKEIPKSDTDTTDGYDITSFEFTFEEQPITQRLKFSIRAIEDVHLTSIQAYYVITKFPPEDIIVHKSEKLSETGLSNVYPSFNMNNRTDTLKLTKMSKITKMMVEFVVEKASTTPYSFYLSFYSKGQVSEVRHFILPEVANGTKLWYTIDKEGIQADTVKVFYVDRIPAIKPHILRFVLH